MPGQPRLLQLTVAVVSLVPILAGANGVFAGPAFLDNPATPDLDSHFRYLSGLLLALGLGFLSTVPDIRRQGSRFRLMATIVVIGGLGRLIGILLGIVPSPAMQGALVIELVVTPALAFWQWRTQLVNSAD